jgi:hypothetical protein
MLWVFVRELRGQRASGTGAEGAISVLVREPAATSMRVPYETPTGRPLARF